MRLCSMGGTKLIYWQKRTEAKWNRVEFYITVGLFLVICNNNVTEIETSLINTIHYHVSILVFDN